MGPATCESSYFSDFPPVFILRGWYPPRSGGTIYCGVQADDPGGAKCLGLALASVGLLALCQGSAIYAQPMSAVSGSRFELADAIELEQADTAVREAVRAGQRIPRR